MEISSLVNKKASIGMKPGTHGSTFGGNPIAMNVGNAVLDQIYKKGFLKKVKKRSEYFHNELNKIKGTVDGNTGMLHVLRGIYHIRIEYPDDN